MSLMKKLSIATVALSMSAAGLTPAVSAPFGVPASPTVGADVLVTPVAQRGDGWRKGHRGSRHQRDGWRRGNDGWWYPLAAFGLGAAFGGALSQPRAQPRAQYRGNAHVDWCYSRWQSYRAYDNSYQPYNGPRRACYSPYS
jgi:hypothetical protein